MKELAHFSVKLVRVKFFDMTNRGLFVGLTSGSSKERVEKNNQDLFKNN